MYRIVPYMLFRAVEDIYIPEDSRHAELVLIFQVASVAPFENQYSNFVFSGLHKRRYIKFRCHVGNLTVSHEFTINPEIKTGINAFKIQVLGKVFLIFIKSKGAEIQSTGVVMGNVRRIIREGIAGIGILMAVIPLGLPD